ncbi:uncharacterized protein LOC125776761 [Bactrocera dorsalis]|uniref:Uncharacterized protein LOC125776761 n=1 Tax=Bactrocera dorsalis TaxID=27457 RepID=A0ABM3JAL7_BACDO|nr:uncharacterized protein LOC125776761 [Bactrocera dorsalis]
MVKPETIANIFKKCQFVKESFEVEELSQEADGIVELVNIDEFLHEEYLNFVHCDDNLPCYGESTDADIIAEAVSGAEALSESSEDEDELSIPTKREVFDSINVLRKALMPSNSFMQEIEDIEQYYFSISSIKMFNPK